MKYSLKNKIRERLRRPFALAVLLVLLFELGFPTATMALTSGPSQPEVQSFEPVGTSQMVDPFSGDFTYNIPLLDIDGYPVNISYHSGIGMDQEASWVGLGWNINPGVINRGMRGIPDDFNGEQITKEFNMKPNRTFGLTLGGGLEFFGKDKAGGYSSSSPNQGGIGMDITVRFNNYTGVGMDRSITGHIPLGKAGATPFTANLGLTSSSDNGLSVQPSASFSARVKKSGDSETSMGLSVGSSFNSRAGLQNLTIGASITKSTEKTKDANGKSSGQNFNSSFNLGMPTYVPELTLPYSNFSISASFKLGAEVQGVSPYGRIAGYYSSQKLTQNSISSPAYGYLNADEGVKYDNALMDFNREKDGAYTPNTPALAIPNFTYDVLSVSGQGIGGSYRPFRSDFGQVFDAQVTNPSNSASIGGEVGLGTFVKVGIDVSVSNVNSKSGRWNNNDGNNYAHLNNRYKQSSADPAYERYYYKEANEKSVDADPTYLQRAGGYAPSNFKLTPISSFNTRLSSSLNTGSTPAGTRAAREKRSQTISMLTKKEVQNGYGLNAGSNTFYGAASYHTSEITSTTPDGRRYVYGIAAYNRRQEEVSFAVGTDEFNSGGRLGGVQAFTGMIKYNPGDNSVSNNLGIDNYYTNTILPPFAHSYLLTAVLSADYVDSDTIKGPSLNDLGTWTKFNYTKTDSLYRWRTPFQKDSANHNEGLKWIGQDDKASYVYGEKEVWYLSSIETKNYVAVFKLEDRKDGHGVLDKNGGLNSSDKSKLLRKISLYTRTNYEAHVANSSVPLNPIKEVHFEYDYSLCPNVLNNSGTSEVVGGNNLNANKGKLTLRKISFSYQASVRGRLSPYKFNYSSFNPGYNIKAYDRWGNYKEQDAACYGANGNHPTSGGLSNAEFPYAEQDKATQDQNASAWNLTEVELPSGGKLQVDYESDDYAYVQNQRAGQMFKIVGATSSTSLPDVYTGFQAETLGANDYFVIRLQDPISGVNPKQQFYDLYLKGIGYMYFRFLYHMRGSTYEYVPGYVAAPSEGSGDYGVYPGGQYAYIRFASVTTNDDGGTAVSPITKAALQFGRLNEPKNLWQPPAVSGSSFGAQLLNSFVNSSFIKNISDALVGPNEALYTKNIYNCCQNFIANKSWLRFNNPDKHKLGGGCRVKKIQVKDEWSSMTNSAMSSFSYGQEYSYENEDGSSSGVAAYEPQLGGDENSMHTPVFFDATKLLAPDDEHYQEEPYGECFFPGPSVGYARVTVQNIKYTGVTKHASGKVVHEFWTARDFPTITQRTGVEPKRDKTNPLSLSSFLNINVRDYMTASQGFYVELNDMHGKPKGQKVYQEGVSTPISSIEYSYKKTPYLNGSYRLDNSASVINPDGTVGAKTVGTFFDMVTDFREQTTTTIGGSVNYNTDVISIVIGAVAIPTIWPGFNYERTRFRSASTTKVVQRFGLIDKVIAKDLGSTVETANLAYDSETGEVILTESQTDYNDPLYSLKFPAYWYYDGMGPAYKNINMTPGSVSYNQTTGRATVSSPATYFALGDELEMDQGSSHTRVWVVDIGFSYVKLIDKNGSKPATGTYSLKVIRSGRRNMQSEQMATITTLRNPLNSIAGNVYDKVIAVSGIEFNDQWSIFCDCYSNLGSSTDMAYVNGSRGNWRKKRAYTFLTNRAQTNYDNNTNTRIDGVFTSFNPLYKRQAGKWQMDTLNWTSTAQVTIMNPNGQELENKDALGRHSAANYGYRQTLATAVAANARFKELGTDNFEEYSLLSCSDKHFKFKTPTIDSLQAHTGKKSIRVSAGAPASLTKKVLNDQLECNNLGQNPCQITSTKVGPRPDGTFIFTFSGNGAIAPLTISWTIVSGSPNVTFNGNSLKIGPTSGSWTVAATVTGATGCTQTLYLSN
jgi:hypothetical protein